MKRIGGRTWKIVAVAAVIVAAIAVVSGFGSGSSSHGLAGGTITVGYGNDLTGFLAVHDKLISNGAKLAVDEINKKGGIGGKVKIKLILEDTKSDPAASVTVAHDLISKKVDVMVLPCNTDFQVAMAAVANRSKQFTLSPCNGDPTVAKTFPVYWPVGPAGNAQMAQLANYAKLRHYTRVYVLDSNMLYVHLMSKYFQKAAPSRGVKIVGVGQIPFGATGFPQDYASIVSNIKRVSPAPDAVMTGLFSPFNDSLVKEMRSEGLKMPVLGADGWDTTLNLTAGGTAIEGCAFSTFGYPSKGSSTAKFIARFKSRFGSPDGIYPGLGYDTIKVLEAAAIKADSTDPQKIAAALGSGLTVNGSLGKIVYPGKGEHNPRNTVAVNQIRGHKFRLVLKSIPTNVPAP